MTLSRDRVARAMQNDDPRCPECDGPIGQTATYCMHCSADLTAEQAVADTDADEVWEGTGTSTARESEAASRTGAGGERPGSGDPLLAPDGLVDNTLTVVVGIAGGVVVGLVGTVVLLLVTGSLWALLFGIVAWLGATSYLVRRRTVQAAVSKTGYAVAIVLLAVPAVALGPLLETSGIEQRGGLFVGLLVFVAVPAVFAAGVGWIAGRFVSERTRESEG
jgi:hypothetical protein